MKLFDSSPVSMPDRSNSAAHFLIPEGLMGRPTLRLKDLLKVMSIGRSQAYVLMKTDPTFPKGVPLYDSENSPKFYWTHEAIAWLQGRASKVAHSMEGN
ncbi:AlpA family phage regulatory protein [Stenotrophomonas sp.]|uniref:AlpA family phage regulatory protein n=1 Tax=Stenotrophomonas sp. TaxID=69392 RepID=UPI0028AE74FD|nr:AlpA family phage regulatory protein [Stenotrophomonas sp.]